MNDKSENINENSNENTLLDEYNIYSKALTKGSTFLEHAETRDDFKMMLVYLWLNMLTTLREQNCPNIVMVTMFDRMFMNYMKSDLLTGIQLVARVVEDLELHLKKLKTKI